MYCPSLYLILIPFIKAEMSTTVCLKNPEAAMGYEIMGIDMFQVQTIYFFNITTAANKEDGL